MTLRMVNYGSVLSRYVSSSNCAPGSPHATLTSISGESAAPISSWRLTNSSLSVRVAPLEVDAADRKRETSRRFESTIRRG